MLLRRYPVSMGLNLAGLVVAFCAFAGIMALVRYEESFDTCYPHHERIFRADQSGTEGIFRSVLPAGFAAAVAQGSPHIVAGTLYCPFAGEQYMVVTDSLGQEHGFIHEANNVTGGFFDVFGIRLVEGRRDAMANPEVLALPQSLARKMFGNSPAVGRHVEIRSGAGFVNGTDWTVGAVYEDLPENSQIRNNVLLPVPEFFLGNFTASNFLCYVRLDDAGSAVAAAEDFNGSFDFASRPRLGKIELTPIEDIYYLEEGSDSRVFRSGSRSRTGILAAVAVLILLTGTFNYTNFYTSLIPSRLRSICTAKVMGASSVSLRLSLVAETMVLALAAWAVSMPVMFLAAGIRADAVTVLVCLGAAVVSGLLSGAYPAVFATSLKPAAVLKGQYGLPPQGRRLRNVLMAVQLVISSALLVFVAYVWLQNRLMERYDCGFDRDRLAVVELTNDMVVSSGERLRDVLTAEADIEGVAFASEVVGGQEVYSTEGVEWRDGSFQCFMIWGTADLLDVLGIEVEEGRSFTGDEFGGAVFNESARRTFGLETGFMQSISAQVYGFCGDVHFSSLRSAGVPVCFRCAPLKAGFVNVAYVRFAENADRQHVAERILEALHGVDPTYPAQVMFYDDIQAGLYAKERSFRTAVLLFSLVAVLLSLSGVFSMVMFDVQSRRRDTALRRVYGASLGDVVAYGNRTYAVTALVSVLAGIPMGWAAVDFWLSNFTVRVGPAVWVFAAVLAAVPFLVSAVVSLRLLSAARTNPAEVLRSE